LSFNRRATMRLLFLGVALLFPLMSSSCVRVVVEIPKSSSEQRANPPPPGGTQIQKVPTDEPGTRREGASLNSPFVIRVQGGGTCATDLHETKAVAQLTDVWCWAASGEGVTSFYQLSDRDFRQCNTVTQLRAGRGKKSGDAPYCCDKANYLDASCQQNGWTHEIFDAFKIDYAWLDRALEKEELYAQICRYGPFSYSIAYAGGFGGHTFVVKDYRIDDNKDTFLYIDSHQYLTREDGTRYSAGFKRVPYEEYASGWYAGEYNKIDYTYVQIEPLRLD